MTSPTRRRLGVLVFPAVLVLGAAAALVLSSEPSSPGVWVFVLVLTGWVVSLCLHEFMHSAVALAGGDVSVRARGYLALNPFLYTNATFSIVIPLILLAVGGIPLPGGAVLIESWRLRARWWNSLVSAAGPLTNLVLGVLFTVVSVTVPAGPLAAGLAFLAVIQFLAAILNLLPVPGLDGFGIIAPYLSPAASASVDKIRPWAPLILFALLFTVPQVSATLFEPAYWFYDLLGGSRGLAAAGSYLFEFWRH